MILLLGAVIILSSYFYLKNNQDKLPHTWTGCDTLNPQYCESNEDCVCKGMEGCFIGGKMYWEKCVDKSQGCTDMCPQECNCISNTCKCTNIAYA